MSDDQIDPDSIRARLDRAVAERLDAMAGTMRRESEHGAFDLEDVRELYKQAI